MEKMAAENKWKRCPRVECGAWIEKVNGCDHVTCRCGYVFRIMVMKVWNVLTEWGDRGEVCYKCGEEYRKCSCYGRPRG